MAALSQGDVAVLDVVTRVGRAGSDLGTGVRYGPSVPTGGRYDPPEATSPSPSAEATMRDVAISRGAERQGRSFSASYMSAGFMLASPDKSAPRHAEQMAAAVAAPTSDLQAVLRVTARRRGVLEEKEPRMRAEAIASDPRHALQMRMFNDKLPNLTPPERMDAFVQTVSKWNFSQQIAFSERRQSYPSGEITSPAPSASPEDRKTIAALGRGYQAIASELRDRGVMPEVMMKGASAVKVAAEKAPVARGRLVRDGVEL